MHGRALVFWERLGAGCVVQVLTAKEAVQHSPVQTIYFCRLLSGTYRPAQAVAIDVNGGLVITCGLQPRGDRASVESRLQGVTMIVFRPPDPGWRGSSVQPPPRRCEPAALRRIGQVHQEHDFPSHLVGPRHPERQRAYRGQCLLSEPARCTSHPRLDQRNAPPDRGNGRAERCCFLRFSERPRRCRSRGGGVSTPPRLFESARADRAGWPTGRRAARERLPTPGNRTSRPR